MSLSNAATMFRFSRPHLEARFPHVVIIEDAVDSCWSEAVHWCCDGRTFGIDYTIVTAGAAGMFMFRDPNDALLFRLRFG